MAANSEIPKYKVLKIRVPMLKLNFEWWDKHVTIKHCDPDKLTQNAGCIIEVTYDLFPGQKDKRVEASIVPSVVQTPYLKNIPRNIF